MEDPRNRDEGERRGSSRGRAVVLALLPPLFLGTAYFLFVEYVLRDALPPGSPLRLTLRLGGAGLALISLVFAAACGYLLAERYLRPLRLLLRLAESGEVQPGRADSLRERGREYLDLHRLLRVLVNQNKAGARAMEELEQLRAALSRFREEISRTGLHGIPPEVTAGGPLRDVTVHVSAKRTHLLSFFRDLRERVGRVRLELVRLGAELGLTEEGENGSGLAEETPVTATEREAGRGAARMPAVARAADEVGASIERLRCVGTVLALESARVAGAPALRTAQLLERFHTGLGELEAVLGPLAVGGNGDSGPRLGAADDLGRAALRERWRRLLEAIESVERRLEEVEER